MRTNGGNSQIATHSLRNIKEQVSCSSETLTTRYFFCWLATDDLDNDDLHAVPSTHPFPPFIFSVSFRPVLDRSRSRCFHAREAQSPRQFTRKFTELLPRFVKRARFTAERSTEWQRR